MKLMSSLLFLFLLLFASPLLFASGFFGGVSSASTSTIEGQWEFEVGIIVGEGANKSTYAPTAVTLDDGVTLTNNGSTQFNGNATISDSYILTGGSLTVNNQHIIGTGDAKSTFTPTSIDYDDGVSLKHNGTEYFDGTSLIATNIKSESLRWMVGVSSPSWFVTAGTLHGISFVYGPCSYNVSLSTMKFILSGATSYGVQIEERSAATPFTEGTDVFSSSITVTSDKFRGGTISDGTLNSGNVWVLQIDSESGTNIKTLTYDITVDENP